MEGFGVCVGMGGTHMGSPAQGLSLYVRFPSVRPKTVPGWP